MTDLPKRPLSQINPRRAPRRLKEREALEIAAANGGEGWIYLQDSSTDRADATTIAAGAKAQITIDGLGPNTTTEYIDTIPRPASGLSLMTGSTFYPVEPGDNYLVRFGFMAAMVDPGLASTEEINGIEIEYDVGGAFNVHEAFTLFVPDPGPIRAERGRWNAMGGVGLLTAIVGGILSALDSDIADAVSANDTTGQKFIEFGQAFAGAAVVSSGVRFFLTPTTDIEVWGADVTITRLSSPTT